jgi:hypothetical protein
VPLKIPILIAASGCSSSGGAAATWQNMNLKPQACEDRQNSLVKDSLRYFLHDLAVVEA